MTLSRRSLITGLVSLVASPAIVRASSLMLVKAWAEDVPLAMCRDERGLIPGWRLLCDSVQLHPGAINLAEPAPGYRFRFERGIMFHEPDPDVAMAT